LTTTYPALVDFTSGAGPESGLYRPGTTGSLADLHALTLSQGDVLYFDGTNLTRLAAGTAGQVLQTNGAGANPSWSAVSAVSVGALTLLGSATASGSSPTLTVSSIPSGYTDLVVRFSGRSAKAAGTDSIDMLVNGDSTNSHYALHVISGNAANAATSGAAASTAQLQLVPVGPAASAAANYPAVAEAVIFDYAGSFYKKMVNVSDGFYGTTNVGSVLGMQNGTWLSTAAITSLTAQTSGAASNLVAGSKLLVYGRS